MIGRFPHLIKTGDFIKLRGHNVSDAHYLQWWKVTEATEDHLKMINRHGKTSQLNIEATRRLQWKCLVWEPGDPREDEKE
jgi:hypothetical protein